MFYSIIILIFVLNWLFWIIYNYSSNSITNTTKLTIINHSPYWTFNVILEAIWTTIPALILILIAYPSFRLLYLTDEIIYPVATIKVIGNQWYWSYEISDSNNTDILNFDSYLIPNTDLENSISFKKTLQTVDNRLILPVNKSIRIIVTSYDVIHSWFVPELGIKVDAIPGRLNQVGVNIMKHGIFIGECAEYCSSGHAFMPIVIEAITPLFLIIIW